VHSLPDSSGRVQGARRPAVKPHRARRHSLGLRADADGAFVPAWELEADAWTVSRNLICDRIGRDLGRYSPEQARLTQPVPAEVDPWGDEGEECVFEVDAAWWDAVRDHSEWWSDLATDTVAEFYGEQFTGDSPAFDDDELDHLAVIDRQLRPRARGIAIDAEEEARNVYGMGWGR
jgi:hypothetical protein